VKKKTYLHKTPLLQVSRMGKVVGQGTLLEGDAS